MRSFTERQTSIVPCSLDGVTLLSQSHKQLLVPALSSSMYLALLYSLLGPWRVDGVQTVVGMTSLAALERGIREPLQTCFVLVGNAGICGQAPN